MAGSKLFMLAGGIVDAGGGRPVAVSAYVVLSGGTASRVFKVKGDDASPAIDELPSATTLDLKRFQLELEEDLRPTLERIRGAGGGAQIAKAAPAWVCGLLRKHLKEKEGIDVD